MQQISDKSEMRLKLRRERRALPNEKRLEYSQKIAENLFETKAYKSCDTVLVFISTRIEVDTSPIIERAFADGKTVAAPRCKTDDNTMRFYSFSCLDELEKGSFDILEPNPACPPVDEFDCAICIVPGLGFDKRGHRMGFGRGYYDRFLSVFSGVSCGVCFDEFIFDEIPTEPTDVPVDLIAVQSGVIVPKKQ